MTIEAITIAAATLLAPVLAWGAQRWYETRPNLIAYYVNISHFAGALPTPNPVPFQMNTHGVVVRNISRRPATNVRLHHFQPIPFFSVYPQITHQVENPGGQTQDIAFPTLVPGEEVMVSYLYVPPLYWNQMNASIRCDQGFARIIPVIPQRIYRRSVLWILRTLLIIGLMTVGYLVSRGAFKLIALATP